jgi:hypothetical protein
MGPYDGIVGAAVDRIGRNVLDVLATATMIKQTGRMLITYGHDGAWNLDDQNDEMLFTMQAMGAQMELRNIQRRNREETIRAREAGQVRHFPSYGFEFIRLVPTGKVDHVALHPFASTNIRLVAERILTDETGTITPDTECARMTREQIPSPADQRAIMYGRPSQGRKWSTKTLIQTLTGKAALGFLMFQGEPVIDKQGNKVRIAPPLWDEATRDQLVAKLARKRLHPNRPRAPKGTRLLSGRVLRQLWNAAAPGRAARPPALRVHRPGFRAPQRRRLQARPHHHG